MAQKNKKVKTSRILLFNKLGQCLVVKRASYRNYPGKWDLPGGRVEQGENIKKSALRELRDETGLQLNKLPKATKLTKVTKLDGKSRLRVLFVASNVKAKKITLDEEHTKYKWTALDKILPRMHPKTRRLIKKSLAMNKKSQQGIPALAA